MSRSVAVMAQLNGVPVPLTLGEDALAAIAAALAVVTTTEPEWLTYEQAGELLGCSRDAVRMRAKRGRLEVRHHGRHAYVSRRSVDRLCGNVIMRATT